MIEIYVHSNLTQNCCVEKFAYIIVLSLNRQKTKCCLNRKFTNIFNLILWSNFHQIDFKIFVFFIFWRYLKIHFVKTRKIIIEFIKFDFHFIQYENDFFFCVEKKFIFRRFHCKLITIIDKNEITFEFFVRLIFF